VSVPPPVLDPRDETAILAALRANAPGYLLDCWRPQAGGAGDTLLRILAHFAGLVVQDLDQAPDKDFLAFLDAMGVALLPPQPARAPLVFVVDPSARTDVLLMAATEVAAAVAPPLPSSLQGTAVPAPPAPIFSTDEALSLARAQLLAVHSRRPDLDLLADHSGSAAAGFTLFGSGSLSVASHHLYLGHDSLFDLPGSAVVQVQVNLAPPPAGAAFQSVELAWEYLTGAGWLPFDPVIDDQTRGMASDGVVLLTKDCGPSLVEASVGGITSRWIRARVKRGLQQPGGPSGAGPLPVVDTLRVQVTHGVTRLPADSATSSGLRLDTSKDFLPFGPQPGVSSTFMLACDDAFGRPGAQVQVFAPLSTPGKVPTTVTFGLAWEYSSGPGKWKTLGQPDHTSNLTVDQGPNSPAFSFAAPVDWQKVPVDGETHHWLRVRVTSGGYGGPTRYIIDKNNNEVVPDTTTEPNPPVVASLTISYSTSTPLLPPEQCLSLNLFAFADDSQACLWGRQPFQPFQAMPDQVPGVYLGFDQPLPVGLVSLYCEAPDPGELEAAQPSAYTWEYWSGAGWSELAVHDETAGFARRGMIQFIGPPDLVADAGPAGPTFWVRARQRVAGEPVQQRVDLLLLNSVWATQSQAVVGEVVGRSDGSASLTFGVQRPPVLGGELVEVQEWRGASREWQGLFADVHAGRLRYDRDAQGGVTGVWVTWEERPHLYASGPHDRVYTLERTSGLLRFGDGALGMIPPAGAPISVSYELLSGDPRQPANVGPGLISQLHTGVPHVQSVANPVAAAGWAAPEGLAGVRVRGPLHLRTRDRALSPVDYETLAREASTEVALVRCLPETGPVGAGQPGWVTIVVAPWSGGPEPRPSVELMERVRDHLAARAPAAIAGQVRVVRPQYVPVSVSASVVVGAAEGAVVEESLRARLDAFLHPLRGGPGGTGWGFGQAVHLSQVAQVVGSTPGVDRADVIQLSSQGAVFEDHVPVGPDRLPSAGRHLLKLRLGG
jgi:hypothetical protein